MNLIQNTIKKKYFFLLPAKKILYNDDGYIGISGKRLEKY